VLQGTGVNPPVGFVSVEMLDSDSRFIGVRPVVCERCSGLVNTTDADAHRRWHAFIEPMPRPWSAA
jgi:hypothetical protein